MEEKIYQFVLYGKPIVQKNNLKIWKKKTKTGKSHNFVGHSQDFRVQREEMSRVLFEQAVDQGLVNPIDYLFEINFKFYVLKAHEPDLDNLPAAVLDALQGIKVDDDKEYQVIINDKQLRKESSEKIVFGDSRYSGEPRTEFELKFYNNKE
jgi:Holliday junction resolvase RusA-like endonuclease